MQGGAIYASASQVLLVQTTAVSNTPDHYAGSTFIYYCNDGFHYKFDSSNCAQCPAGRYKNFALNPDALACKECPEGRYGDPAISQAGSSHCQKCPAGYYGPDTSATVCTACPAGRYGQFPGETSLTCTAECPATLVVACTSGTASPMAPVIGFYLADVAAQEQRPCPTGKFKSSLSFDECQSCPVGKFNEANASTFCFECPAGYHGPLSTSSSCSACDGTAGEYQDQFGNSGCKSCSALVCAAA
jgi:hypothetical protein